MDWTLHITALVYMDIGILYRFSLLASLVVTIDSSNLIRV